MTEEPIPWVALLGFSQCEEFGIAAAIALDATAHDEGEGCVCRTSQVDVLRDKSAIQRATPAFVSSKVVTAQRKEITHRYETFAVVHFPLSPAGRRMFERNFR